MKYFPFFISGLMLFSCTFSQTFEKHIPGYFFNADFPGRNVHITAEGDYLVAGKTPAIDGTNMIALTKFSKSGNQLWTKYYETGSFVNYHITMAESPDGGFVISASWPYEVRFIKIGADGEKVWTKTISSERYEDRNPTIIETDSSDFMIAGTRTLGPGNNYQRVVALTRINSDGEIETEKNIVEETHLTLQFIEEIETGGYILGGYMGFPYPEGSYLYVARLDENGDPVWSKTYEDIKTVLNSNVEQTKNNQYIIVGTYRSADTYRDKIFLMWIDENGNIVWKKTQFFDMTRAYGVKQTYDNGFVVVGSTEKYGNGQHDLLVLKTNIIGDSVWAKTYGGAYADYGYEIHQTADSGFIVNGESYSFGQDFSYLIKTNSHGDVACRTDHNLFYFPYLKSVTAVSTPQNILASYEPGFGDTKILLYKESVIPDNYILVNAQEINKESAIYDTTAIPGMRSYRYQIRIVNECGDTSLPSRSHKSIFLEVYDGGNNTRNLVWNHYEGAGINSYVILRGTGEDDLAVIDSIPGSINIYSDLSPPAGENHYQILGLLTRTAGSDAGNLRTYSNIFTIINVYIPHKTTDNLNSVIIYPNPVNSQSIVEFSNPDNAKYSYHIIDAYGREIRNHFNIRGNRFVFDKRGLTGGIYFIELRGPAILRAKVVVQ